MRDTIDMARESWVDVYGLGHDRAKFIEALKHFECLARADEREACAKVADHYSMHDQDTPADIAEAIRGKGNT
jgi:hypothetical protein